MKRFGRYLDKIKEPIMAGSTRRHVFTEISKIDEYLQKVNSGKLVVAQFGASWCAPCKKMKPIIKMLGEDNEDIESLYVDIDEHPELGENEDINELPTILLRKNGKYLDKIVGMNEEELLRAVNTHKIDN
ncbi:thioredoxin-like protein 2 [Plasmodium gonderi]|uniref:Thioredoxin-like protein 2 n=1 Tax=Plasmodium gonderi TaxID=77519 RepID=A0A1Y1JF89_PLAGO|nr:thioredoxin-like protein 2 [Plasmodium gonderi]GAW80318.1 thioredoxin-like protein 2 [Plasmodium gonderi]